jgi:aspartate aminotransferase
MAERTGRATVAVTRYLEENGKFTLPKLFEIEKVIQETDPSALLVIPYDNPTGQFFSQEILNDLGKLCVKYNLWMISDESYREVFYISGRASSIWGVTEKVVPGITGRRMSIESSSKIWDACGLRIGALVTDNEEFHQKAVAENTANLCANVIGQYIFGALLHETKAQLHAWFKHQRDYYQKIATTLTADLKKHLPKLIVAQPDSSLYTVVDVRNIVSRNFDAKNFVMYCAQKGEVNIHGVKKTLLVSPMEGFYSSDLGQLHPGKTQMRIAYVEPPEIMAEVPILFAQLLHDYTETT